MNLKQAVDLLKAKTETPEEKLALALLVCELDTQFCYGWGAGCVGTADWLNKTIFVIASPTIQEKVASVGVWMSSSPGIGDFRDDDFPQTDEFSKLVDDENNKEIPF